VIAKYTHLSDIIKVGVVYNQKKETIYYIIHQ